MKQLFLTSEVNLVAGDIRDKINIKGNLRTAYITTPIEKGCDPEDMDWHEQNKKSMKDAGFDIFEYIITGKNLDELEKDLNNFDVVYVEGGSLIHMMNESRRSGFDKFIRKFVEDGGVYIGTSTGSFIMATDTEAGLVLEDYHEDNFNTKGIGLVNFLVMPHWGTDNFKDHYNKMPDHAYKTTTPMIILTDTQYVWVRGEDIRIIDVL